MTTTSIWKIGKANQQLSVTCNVHLANAKQLAIGIGNRQWNESAIETD
jgi:hypothetical protein